jgi:glutathione S-transferase
MSTYKLHYFHYRGLAEVSRLIFVAAGQNYEDVRYESNEWPSHEAQMPLGQVPVLEYKGTQLPQSMSIARFLAKQLQLAGKDNFEQAKVDAVIDTILDLFRAFVPSLSIEDETKKQEARKKFFDEDMPKHLQNLEVLAKLYGNGGPYFVNNQLTWADLLFHTFGETFLNFNPDCLNNHTWLQQNRAQVEKNPNIAKYLKNRPKTQL